MNFETVKGLLYKDCNRLSCLVCIKEDLGVRARLRQKSVFGIY
jgi:hypothetical protein